jgi:spore germination protein PE
MLKRLSNVDRVNVMIATFSSVIQLGDSSIVNGLSDALVVQREEEIFYAKEGNLPSFPVITRPILLPSIDETISFRAHNPNPIIKVKKVDITAISNSSILHVGNNQNVSMEARVKHIRQLLLYGHEHELS